MTDHENRIKIGDFGLAATDFAPVESSMDSAPLRAISDAADLTSGIGTSLYIAPEVESSGKARGSEVNYNDKADMVSRLLR